MDGNPLTGLADANGLQRFDVFPPLDALDQSGRFGWKFRRSQQRNRAAQDFLCAVSVHSFGRRVPARNAVVEVHSDNGLIGILHDGSQVSQTLICIGKLGGTGAHAFLQRLVRLFQICFPAFRQPGGTDEHETLRNQRRQDDGGANGSRGCHEFDDPGKPIERNPEGPDLHKVGRPAGQDEHPEPDEYPREREVALRAANEVGERQRNGDIGGADRQVGEQMQPDEPRMPKITMPVRHEGATFEEAVQELGHAVSTLVRETGKLLCFVVFLIVPDRTPGRYTSRSRAIFASPWGRTAGTPPQRRAGPTRSATRPAARTRSPAGDRGESPARS